MTKISVLDLKNNKFKLPYSLVRYCSLRIRNTTLTSIVNKPSKLKQCSGCKKTSNAANSIVNAALN
ncbi:hypothetical protein BpHYR1_019132 [Brachionus plicatilis]|uniref:Uncharacterized protein n=1 Tax=Brachionus plicatilis TaxID=10195 RepID=A0A3M7RHC0_BRAPC|nr:hypothetical protein BpHYR1_019132 [Brachionus plicatilis]